MKKKYITNEERLEEYLKSKEFQKDIKKFIEQETWGKGFPKIYLDKNGDIVEHWKDGTINVLKTKEELNGK